MHVTEKGELEYLLEFVEYPDEGRAVETSHR
uniref:Uncharacterized protein n=1 Tax=Leersia perrieri TaxID=77586 RepID=A0A0D9WCK0_9ORYZ